MTGKAIGLKKVLPQQFLKVYFWALTKMRGQLNKNQDCG